MGSLPYHGGFCFCFFFFLHVCKYVGWSFIILIGPPMPSRLKGRGQKKSDPLSKLEVEWNANKHLE